MALRIYKPKQGVRARLVALAFAAVVGYFGGRWLRAELIEASPAVSWGVPIGFAVAVMLAALWLMNWPRLVDLLVETETELNKVSWSSRRDLWRSTWVVIFSIVFMSTFMFVVVKILEPVFFRIGVLVRPSRETAIRSESADWPWSGASRLVRVEPPSTGSPERDG